MHCGICNGSMNSDWHYCPHCGAKATTPNPPQQPAGTSVPSKSSVRAQVFEVIIRQAMAGVPWRQICAAPMHVNNITEEMVEEELERRKNGGVTPSLDSAPEPPLPMKNTSASPSLNPATEPPPSPVNNSANTAETLPSRVIDNTAYLLESLAGC